MSNAEHLANVMVQAFIDAVENGVDLVPVVADSTSTAKIAPFIKQFPDRLVNVGIAEQSMVGMAAGLALGGKVAVTCNAAPFLISRANEQIKVDVCYNNTNVKLFGLNAGASYGPLASTHHAIDDLAVMRGFGNIEIYAPSSPRECRQIIDYALQHQGPVYIRLDGKALPELYAENYRFVPGAVNTLREGHDLALVATGSTVHEIVEAAQTLAESGIQAQVVSVPSIRPCDTPALLAALKGCNAVITVEEHNVNGGLGSLVAEVMAEAGIGIPLKRLGIPDGEYAAAADRGWMRQHHGFDAQAIISLAKTMC
ncbi:transketolase family protein [Raoultella planticola]|uniref:Transketolase C-terminal domain-containing protein n=1 Tax=Raoultella planticola TaxID=575 RepID=A0ABU5LX80_RAOPL|nr:transketolase C-terminal domain-containing protein [Raoultella planticola]MDW4551865.1 transketolase C-terminal domain-containing protein [Raoultella planticola]MDZ7443577.1 transketolase C-terminal domain-containing protein [Raoultella planticola]MDZ7464548.1 transketolase C-terminal domain-containing protein [Raoultella planticola]MDZ7505376.1 transketolase C-terminal domain-containing protein [Raoultella planticola]MEA5393426.1 transketolase C-terminal domain-containing protein [Raoultel